MAKIYLDYAATTPVDPNVLKAMSPYFKKDFGNPSSIHGFGQKALGAVDEAREKLANFLGCDATEIVFTGSATEANNLAIFGLVGKGDHIITSQIEHHAVLEPCQILEKRGVEVTYLPVTKEGLVDPDQVKKAIRPNTVLVSIMYANNEIGTVQPVAEIGQFLKSKAQNPKPKIYFHTDAVQAVNYLDCNVKNLGVDLLTISSHKIYGPKGVGSLFVRKGVPLKPIIYGGGHERGLRSGTENVAGVVGLGQAVEEIQNPKLKIQNIRIRQLRDKIIKRITKIIPDSRLNGSPKLRLPNNINISFKGVEGEALVIALDQKGIAVSTGSACSSKSLKPSHVLLALGLSQEQAHGSLRISLGKFTTEKEIEKFLKVLPSVVKRLREISGYK
ncbi:MAG: cysteine desulfurase NifS [Candidatus Nealsonbacteria bacterium]|nr:MAG: cysteine desulfurase NifS [Candidatus Nealsonbacteria bacterium]